MLATSILPYLHVMHIVVGYESRVIQSLHRKDISPYVRCEQDYVYLVEDLYAKQVASSSFFGLGKVACIVEGEAAYADSLSSRNSSVGTVEKKAETLFIPLLFIPLNMS